MNATILRRLVWKEFRTTIALWLAMVGLCFFLQLAVVTQNREVLLGQSQQRLAEWLYMIALFVTTFYAVACAGMQYALEHETGTFGLLRSLPLTVREVFTAKSGWAIASTVALVPVLWGLAFFFSGLAAPHGQAGELVAAFGLFALQALAWGTLFSLLSSRPMVAILGAGAALAACVVAVLNVFSYLTLWHWLSVDVVLVAVNVWLAPRWFDRWKVGRKRLPIAESLAESLGGSWRMPHRGRRPEFVSLCLHHVRQSRAFLGLGAVIVFCWFIGRLLTVTGVLSRYSVWYSLAIIPVVIAAIIYPSLAFHADQRQRGYRFLSHHGVTPRKAWWSRQLVWTTSYLVLTFFFIFSLVMGESLGRLRWEIVRDPNISPAIALWLLVYACGALVSILLRSGILAVVVGAALTIALMMLAGFLIQYVGIMGWVPVAAIAVGFFIASRLHAADWLAERRNWRSRLRWTTPAFVPFVFLLVATPFLRVYQIPAVPDPGFSPSRLEKQAYSPEGVARLGELVAIAGLPRETVVVDEPGASPEGKKTEQVLSDEAVKRLVALTADWPKPAPYREPLWMDSWASLAEARGARGHPGPASLVAHLILHLQATTERYQRMNRLHEALDCRIALARMTLAMTRPGYFKGGNGLADMRGWAGRPGMTPDLLKEAISRVDALAPDHVDYTLGLELDYLVVRRYITDDAFFAEFYGGELTARRLLPFLYPWERTRGLRHLRYAFRDVLEQVQCLADLSCEPNSPPLESASELELRERVRARARARTGGPGDDIFESVLLGFPVAILFGPPQIREFEAFETQRRVAQAELAVEAWRLAHDGKLPDSLDQLIGVYLKQRPVDPVTKTAFWLVLHTTKSGQEYSIRASGRQWSAEGESLRGDVRETEACVP